MKSRGKDYKKSKDKKYQSLSFLKILSYLMSMEMTYPESIDQ